MQRIKQYESIQKKEQVFLVVGELKKEHNLAKLQRMHRHPRDLEGRAVHTVVKGTESRKCLACLGKICLK